MTYAPDGPPNGHAIRRSSRPVRSAMSYIPEPPMIPISIDIGMFALDWRQPPLAVLFPNAAGGDERIVLEEDQHVLLHRLGHESLLGRQRVHRIQVVAH